MIDFLIRASAIALNPTAPTAGLAKLAGRPKSTARSWCREDRRPPIAVLQALHAAMVRRHGELARLIVALERLIYEREREPKRRRGFFRIDPTTGQNRANRKGRPRKQTTLP
jgi:hypothetical protein